MIFVDSTYLIALLLEKDQFHSRAIELKSFLNEKRIINNTVLTETLNAFTGCGGKLGFKFFDVLVNTHDLIYLTNEDYTNAIETYLNYDSAINYSDCTILQTMKKFNINKIASFDSDFEKIQGINVIK